MRDNSLFDAFEADQFPGKPRILFVGIARSTHTHAWIGLLAGAELNVRLFAMPYERSPSDAPIKTYLSVRSWGPPNALHRYIDYPILVNNVKSPFAGLVGFWKKAVDPHEWLSTVIRHWRPDVIHTLGLFDEQGGQFYHEARGRFGLQGIGKWVLQLRGGSDIALRRHHPESADQILKILNECDEVITDNHVNINYIKQLGLGHKIASIAPVPGTGGLDTDTDIHDVVLPSKRERIILWPKAYESPWSKALPVLEAIRLAWEEMKPCKIYMTASIPETENWFWAILPPEVRANCSIVQRIPRNELLDLMKKARVLLAPSLVDGVPNSLYEAMIYGTFPIVSPLETITPLVQNERNVLFARNLYPTEISGALVRAMSDDSLVDEAAKNNLTLVKQVASRKEIAKRVIDYYQRLSSQSEVRDLNPSPFTMFAPTYSRAHALRETIKHVAGSCFSWAMARFNRPPRPNTGKTEPAGPSPGEPRRTHLGGASGDPGGEGEKREG